MGGEGASLQRLRLRRAPGKGVHGGTGAERAGQTGQPVGQGHAGTVRYVGYLGALDGATSYNLAWKPVREDFETANAATVTSNSADFTVSGYGQWTVRLEGCNDAGCGPSMYYGTGVAPGGPDNLAVSAAPGELDLSATWDALDGATLYKLSWRQSDGDFEEGNAIWVSTGGATITVEDYGQWVVRLEGCNDAGCGPPVSRPVEVEPTPAPVDLRLGPSLNDEGQSRPRSFTASWDPVPDASSYTLRWQRNGAEPQTAKQLTAPAEQTSAEFTVSEDGAYDVELKGIGSDGVVGSGRAEMQVQSQGSGHASFYRKGTPYHGCSFAGGIRLEAKPVSGGLELRWSSNNGLIDLYQYQFRRAQQFTEGSDWTDIPDGGDAVSHTFTGLENGKTYFIALRGVVTGWRPCIEWRINVTPSDPSIPALTGFDAVPVPNKSRQVKLSWDDPGDNSLTYQYNQPPISSSGIIRCGPQSPAPKSLRPTARCPTSSQE